jgi:hypothetical protein
LQCAYPSDPQNGILFSYFQAWNNMVTKLAHETCCSHVLSEIVQGTRDDPHPVSQNALVKSYERVSAIAPRLERM